MTLGFHWNNNLPYKSLNLRVRWTCRSPHWNVLNLHRRFTFQDLNFWQTKQWCQPRNDDKFDYRRSSSEIPKPRATQCMIYSPTWMAWSYAWCRFRKKHTLNVWERYPSYKWTVFVWFFRKLAGLFNTILFFWGNRPIFRGFCCWFHGGYLFVPSKVHILHPNLQGGPRADRSLQIGVVGPL